MTRAAGRTRAAVLAGLAACGSAATPTPAPGSDPRAATAPPAIPALVLAAASEPGVRLTLDGEVVDRAGRPVGDADVHAYQADATGAYTPSQPMDEPHARLAGRVRTDTHGRFAIRTIRPGPYPQAVILDGVPRHIPAHVHVDVTAAGHAERRLQVVFADDASLRDPYWAAWLPAVGQAVTARPLDGGGGQGATLTITLP